MSPSTTRWCPTPEQLMILEELYSRGVRTPNATQIQKITTHLALYGKIQGKNVFYWFQNHKARDRQKMRKKLAKQLHEQHLLYTTSFQNAQQTNSRLHPYNLHYFQCAPLPPPHFRHDQLISTCSTQRLHPQARGCWEDAPIKVENLRVDLPRDRAIAGTSCIEKGPTSFSENRPLQTLELFPLKSERAALSNN